MADVATNCGILTPTTYDIITLNGSPDPTKGHIPYFHSMMCQWAYTVAQQFSWVIVINAINKSYLLNKIQSTLPTLEPTKWQTSNIVNDTWNTQTQDTIGCIFAQGVRLPGENVNHESAGITTGSRRGFINAPIITGRSDFEPLEIGFIEMNQSFVDGVLRPWLVVLAHEGLLAKSDGGSIKSNIYVYQLARAGENTNVIRKNWTFYNCVPLGLPSEDLTYTAGDYGKKQVQFTYTHYDLVDTQSPDNSTTNG